MNLRRVLSAARSPARSAIASTLDAASATSDESSNAFDFFQAAAGRLVLAETVIDMVANTPRRVYTNEEKGEVRRANFDVFPLLERGLTRSYIAPRFDASRANFYFRQFRALSNLLTLDADIRLAHGDAGGAIDRYLDAIQMGQKFGQNGAPTLARFVGIACQSIAQRHAWQAIDLIPTATARQASRRLQTILDSQPPYAANLRAEKPVGHEMLEDTFQKQDAILPPLLRRYGGKQQMLAAYDAYVDVLIARSRKRYGMTEQADASPVPSNPLNEKGDLLWKMRFNVANVEQTQNALLLTALALHAYQVEQRGLPATLAWLCPEYLREIPDDEFAAHGPLRYRLVDAKRYVLYSVGPDGSDEGGVPIDNPVAAVRTDVKRRLVQPDSVGDIVAGVNF